MEARLCFRAFAHACKCKRACACVPAAITRLDALLRRAALPPQPPSPPGDPALPLPTPPPRAPPQDLHGRLEPLLIFTVDGASFIDPEDARWELVAAVMDDGG